MSKVRKDGSGTARPMATVQTDQPGWEAFGNLIERIEPVSRSLACTQLATASLMGRRARAYLDHPAKLATCKTPQDAFQVQMAFWQDATRAYTAYASQIMTLWQQALGVPPAQPSPAPKAAPTRDLIWVPDAPAAKVAAEKVPGENARDAA